MPSIPPISRAVDIHESKAPQVYAAAITSYFLAVVAVALRFWARRLMKAEIWVDDWSIAGALVIATGFFADILLWLHQGFGQHYELLGKDYLTKFGKNVFAEEILYFLVIGLVKLSILAFYWRLFKTSIRIPCYVLGAVVSCWEIASLLLTVFQCVPLSGFWDHSIGAKCINNKHFYLGAAVPNIITDAALLLLPIPYIWRLHTTTPQKIALTGTFMLGGFVTVISIIRLPLLLKLNLDSIDLDYSFINFGTWSIAESNIAIVAACLPSLRPILSLILYGEPSQSVRSSRGTAFGQSWTRNQPSAVVLKHAGQPTSSSESQHNFIPLPDEAFELSGIEQMHSTVTAGTGERNARDIEDLELQTGDQRAKSGIQVRSEVTVQSRPNK